MRERELHDGRQDGLTPLESLDLNQVRSFADLLRAMAKTAFSGRQLGEAFEILLEMARDRECVVVLTLSGAMTVAKQGRILCEMIDRGLVQIIVSTGALIAHGLTESIGLVHYRYDPSQSDELLFRYGYNRVYDTLELEANLDNLERLVTELLDAEPPDGDVWSSASLCRAIGKRLSEMDQGPGILRSAFENNVPVFIPAFTDCELGLDVATWAMRRHVQRGAGSMETAFQAVPPFNPFLD
ncbi:MAG TPA: deoxyhypusine synthase, partial [Planctomycetaceae bacterium]|nr:deoxyhypusine synthase [Planctomycetaceae bacterium]